jgi:hypothetical protein
MSKKKKNWRKKTLWLSYGDKEYNIWDRMPHYDREEGAFVDRFGDRTGYLYGACTSAIEQNLGIKLDDGRYCKITVEKVAK